MAVWYAHCEFIAWKHAHSQSCLLSSEGNNSIGGLHLESASQKTIYIITKPVHHIIRPTRESIDYGTDSTRTLEMKPSRGFVPDPFDFSSFHFGCNIVDRDRRLITSVGCSIIIRGYNRVKSLVATQTFDFKPDRHELVDMRKVKLNYKFEGLIVLHWNTISKEKSRDTVVLRDNVSVALYRTDTP